MTYLNRLREITGNLVFVAGAFEFASGALVVSTALFTSSYLISYFRINQPVVSTISKANLCCKQI